MAKTMRELRMQARKAGVMNYTELTTTKELEEAIAAHVKGTNGATSVRKTRGATKGAVKRGPGRPRKTEVVEEEAPRKRGRPKGSTNKSSAKVTTEPTKRPAGSPRLGRPPGTTGGTRVAVPSRINFKADPGFREGSVTYEIFIELREQAKQFKDTADLREAVYETLLDYIGEEPFIFKNRQGKRLLKAEAQKYLRYRINRTIFDYVKLTGQHDGGNGNGNTQSTVKAEAPAKRGPGRPKKSEATVTPKRGPGRPRKAPEAVSEAPRKRGRPPKVQAEAVAPKRRGRPKGSKNRKARA